jgi:hypothetical protein
MSERPLFEPPPEIEPERPGSAWSADLDLALRPFGGPGDERQAFLRSGAGERVLSRLRFADARRRRRRITAFSAAAAGLVAVLAGVTLWPRSVMEEPRGGGIRLKGGSSIAVYRKRGAEVAPVSEGALLHPGDQVRFVVLAERPHVMIVNVEARGEVRPFYPYPAGHSLAVKPGARFELPGSIELDESLGAERIIAVFSDRPLGFDEVRAAIREGAPGRLGTVVTLGIEKRARPR